MRDMLDKFHPYTLHLQAFMEKDLSTSYRITDDKGYAFKKPEHQKKGKHSNNIHKIKMDKLWDILDPNIFEDKIYPKHQ